MWQKRLKNVYFVKERIAQNEVEIERSMWRTHAGAVQCITRVEQEMKNDVRTRYANSALHIMHRAQQIWVQTNLVRLDPL